MLKDEEVDVLIVGSGFTGALTAGRLAEAGCTVMVLERGDWPDYSTTRATEVDFEASPGREWLVNPNRRQLPGDQPIDDSDSAIAAIMLNSVGGSAVAYAGQWHRNMPSDFRVRSLDGVADDWPTSYEELMPYYRELERIVGVSGLNGDPAFPGTAYPMPPVRLHEWGRRAARAHDELGWHWWPASNAIATRAYGALAATAELGTEFQGDPVKAKATPDLVFWPDLLARGVKLSPRCTATMIETDAASDLATGVIYRDADGREQRQRARTVVLAANGVGTPWLLLNSASPQHPDGVANSSGMVGKRLMMHPLSTVVGLFHENLGSTQGSWGQQMYSMQFYETDESRGFVRGARWAMMPAGGPLQSTREYPYGTFDGWGDSFYDTVRERVGHGVLWSIISEDLPVESNRVTLSSQLTDEYGFPAPKLTYRNSDNSERLLRFQEAKAKESFEAAGAHKVIVSPSLREIGWHLLGTAVMGHDPTRSVVDGYGRAHDVANLFVFDGSIWPTSSGTNPTATIAAMALRNADHLVANRSQQKVPQ